MTRDRDRGQYDKEAGQTLISILIIAVVAYVALDFVGISLWDVLLVVGGLLAVALVLLLARGAYLIGSGSDAEYQARSKAADSPTMGTGFALLDTLRTANLPIVSWLEGLLGRENPGRMVRCGSCRNVFVDESSGSGGCPNCGDTDIKPVR